MKVARYCIGILVCGVVAALVLTRPAHPQHAPAVYAAASLRQALRDIEDGVPYSFAGSGRLQRQIEDGAPADVFASASPTEPQALFRAGRCSAPQTFATNRLVLIVPRAAGGRVAALDDLGQGGLRVAVGAPDVPVGRYTRQALARLGRSAVLRDDVVSQEPDVAGVAAKVALGSADAGFVYHTDALATHGRTREIALPARAQPVVRYQVCVVRRRGAQQRGARAFVARLTGVDGRRVLARYGFGLPGAR